MEWVKCKWLFIFILFILQMVEIWLGGLMLRFLIRKGAKNG